jgi:hypothetical protein
MYILAVDLIVIIIKVVGLTFSGSHAHVNLRALGEVQTFLDASFQLFHHAV